MIFSYLFNCMCPRIIDEDELKANMSSDTSSSVKTLPPPDFIPTNEFNYNTTYSTSYSWYQFINNH